MNYRGRKVRAQEAMRAQGLDWLLVAASADLTYLTGLHIQQGDRLTALLLPATGKGTLLVPDLEAAALDQSALPAPLLRWPDGTDPLALIVERLSGALCGSFRICLGFFLRFLHPAFFRCNALLLFPLECQDACILGHLGCAARSGPDGSPALFALQIIFGARVVLPVQQQP